MSKERRIYVVDLETAYSADSCRLCGKQKEEHVFDHLLYCPVIGPGCEDIYRPIGWENKAALGLSIGAWYSYVDERVHWFDEDSLETTMLQWVNEQPLLVSFAGMQFDFCLMRAVLRRHAETLPQGEQFVLEQLCDDFKALCTTSYDILAEIWTADPASKMVKGLNSLDAVAQANGLGAKSGHGAQAPRDWAAGRWARVLNYCSFDVELTKKLFEMICAGTPIQRAGGRAVLLPIPEEATLCSP